MKTFTCFKDIRLANLRYVTWKINTLAYKYIGPFMIICSQMFDRYSKNLIVLTNFCCGFEMYFNRFLMNQVHNG